MTKPPVQKPVHTDSVQTSLRIPRQLHATLQAEADRNARSLNAEILLRLQASPLDEVRKQHAEIKAMLRALLDRS
jgi:hypothetical protein